jgi:hypothetical protein
MPEQRSWRRARCSSTRLMANSVPMVRRGAEYSDGEGAGRGRQGPGWEAKAVRECEGRRRVSSGGKDGLFFLQIGRNTG